MLTQENLKKLESLKKQYPTSKSLTLPVLWMIQEQHGWISPDAMRYVATLLDLPERHVYGVVTFYTMYNTHPVGKYHLQVCTNISCMLRGSGEIMANLCSKLQVGAGATTPDAQYTVTEVECLGSCGTAPMMQVNDEYYEDLTSKKIDALLAELK